MNPNNHSKRRPLMNTGTPPGNGILTHLTNEFVCITAWDGGLRIAPIDGFATFRFGLEPETRAAVINEAGCVRPADGEIVRVGLARELVKQAEQAGQEMRIEPGVPIESTPPYHKPFKRSLEFKHDHNQPETH